MSARAEIFGMAYGLCVTCGRAFDHEAGVMHHERCPTCCSRIVAARDGDGLPCKRCEELDKELKEVEEELRKAESDFAKLEIKIEEAKGKLKSARENVGWLQDQLNKLEAQL